MSFIGKDPRVNSVITTDIGAGTPSNPAAGSFKTVDRGGFLYNRSSAGSETAVTPEVTQAATGLVLSAGQLKGTNTNDDAASGYVGESLIQSFLNFSAGASDVYTDPVSLGLTAGDWDVTFQLQANATASTNGYVIAVTSIPGNDPTNFVFGDNALTGPSPASFTNCTTISNLRIQVPSGTVTYYAKWAIDYSGTTPTASGRFSARRVR